MPEHHIYYHPSGQEFCSKAFANQLRHLTPAGRPILILCIGSDHSTGDSLGPLVGYKLQKQLAQNPPKTVPVLDVFGTLQHPVHAINLQDTLLQINQTYQRPFIIAIDASLGQQKHIGCITLSNTPLSPGLGIGKTLPRIGQVSITGIVSMLQSDEEENTEEIPAGYFPPGSQISQTQHSASDTHNLMRLQSVSLCLVMRLADCITESILQAYTVPEKSLYPETAVSTAAPLTATALWSGKRRWPLRWWKPSPAPGSLPEHPTVQE